MHLIMLASDLIANAKDPMRSGEEVMTLTPCSWVPTLASNRPRS